MARRRDTLTFNEVFNAKKTHSNIVPLSLTRKEGEFMILQTLYNGYI